jgi:ABC-type Mn2+/Zn2+ transport system ATPase subunit
MAVVGPNGGGKTTLLRTILGMVPMTQGKLFALSAGRGTAPFRH